MKIITKNISSPRPSTQASRPNDLQPNCEKWSEASLMSIKVTVYLQIDNFLQISIFRLK